MVELYVTHRDHNFADLATYKAQKPTYTFRLNDAGDISYQLALSQLDTQGIPIPRDGFAPQRTDYFLRGSTNHGQTFFGLQSGIHTSVGISADEYTVKVAGQDYMSWLDQPWPFDYKNNTPYNLSDTAVLFQFWDKATATQQIIIEDLVASLSGDPSVYKIPITTEFNGQGFDTEFLDNAIQYFDSTSVLGHIKSIAALTDPFGFDFYMGFARILHMFYPRTTGQNSVFPIYYLNASNSDLVHFDWANNGPVATQTVGLTSDQFWSYSEYPPSTALYRQRMRIAQLPETARLPAKAIAITAAIGKLDRYPHKDLKVKIRPDSIDPFDETAGFKNLLGKCVYVYYDNPPYHRIDAPFYITEQEISPIDDDGNYVSTWSLQQVY